MSTQTLHPQAETVKLFAACLQQVPAPHNSKGSSRTFQTILAVTILALLADESIIAAVDGKCVKQTKDDR